MVSQTDTTDLKLDGAGRPIKGDLKDRAISRGHKMTYYADQLRPRGHNPRDWSLRRNRLKVIEFAQTIHSGGVRNPITVVKEGDDILVDHGMTRWLAVKLLEGEDIVGVLDGITDPKLTRLLGLLDKNTITIPAVSGPKRNELDLLTDTVVHNTGNQFADLEYARIIKQYTDWGKGQGEIAELLGGEAAGWTQTRVSHIYQLNFASPRLQALLGDEVILTTTVVTAMRDYEGGAEAAVLAAIADAKARAAAEADTAEAQAIAAQEEVDRIIAQVEKGEDPGMVVPEGSRRPIPALEAAQRKATRAAERSTKAKRVVNDGPERITSRDIATAVARRDPTAQVNPSLSKAGVLAFIDGVKFEAQYSIDADTRQRMNDLLKKFGLPEMPARVDNAGNPLPLPEETAAAA